MNNQNSPKSFFPKLWSAVSEASVYLYRRAKHNFLLKALSVFFAILLCSVIMMQANPDRKTTLHDVPVSYTGLEILKGNNLTLSLEQLQTPLTTSVVLNVPMQERSQVNKDRVSAHLDLSNITLPGEHEVSVSVTTTVGTIRTRTPAQFVVKVENLVSKTIPVVMKTKGELYENYAVGATSIQPGYITVSGPESAVDRVYHAVVQPNLNGETRSMTDSMPVTLVDESGNDLDAAGLTLSSKGVVVNVEIRKSMEMPINAMDSVVGEEDLPDGYSLSSVSVYPEKVTVTGSVDLLANISQIHCATLNISQVTGTKSFTVNLVPVAGLSFSVNQVEVQVTTEPELTTKVFTGLQVNTTNVAPGLAAVLENNRFSISVTGPKAVLNEMNPRSFELIADCTGLSVGTHQITVRAVVENDYATDIANQDIFVSPGTVVLRLEVAP